MRWKEAVIKTPMKITKCYMWRSACYKSSKVTMNFKTTQHKNTKPEKCDYYILSTCTKDRRMGPKMEGQPGTEKKRKKNWTYHAQVTVLKMNASTMHYKHEPTKI